MSATKIAKFELGTITATPNALMQLGNLGQTPDQFIRRHASGDWGDGLSADDSAMNDEAVKSGEDRVFSSYKLASGQKVWVITEHDRSVTTVLMPEDY